MKRIVCFLLGLVMLLSLSMGSLTLSAGAVTQADIDALKQQAAEIAENKKNLNAQIAELKKKVADASAHKKLLDQKSDLIRDEIGNAESQIDRFETLIEQTREELELTRAEEEKQYEIFTRRVRAMEERGTISYWSVLFNADSFTDLLSTLDDVGEIMDSDQRAFDALRTLRESMEEKKATLENSLAEVEAQKKLLEEKRAELDKQVQEAAGVIAEISSTKAGYEKLLKAEEAEANSIDAQIRQMQAALAGGGKLPEATLGGYIWPVTTSKKITSPFGARRNPVTGRTETHKGVDIGGVYYSSNILAAKAGTVIISQYGSSYGNYVVISHGSGNTTLYAHMSQRLVSAGAYVNQGDVIGITGSTGNSTGPHLHFEITENGGRVDPLKYLANYVKGWS